MRLRDLIGSDAPVPEQFADDASELRRARRRVAKMSVHELLNWADQAGSGMAKAFDDYRKDPQMTSLDEIASGLIALTAVTEQLIARQEAQ